MRNYYKVLGLLGLQLLAVACFAEPVNIGSARYSTQSLHNRLLLDVSASPKHRVFVLDNPSRLVIDVKNARLKQPLSQPSASHPLFSRVRTATKNDDTDLRIVVDLKKKVDSKSFSLSSNNHDEHRLTIDLLRKTSVSADKTEDKIAAKPDQSKTLELQSNIDKLAGSTSSANKKTNNKTSLNKKTAVTAINSTETTQLAKKTQKVAHKTDDKNTKPIVVAIDAGHGGNDPGAHGPKGTEEKAVTFAIARKLEKLINSEPGMKAVMVRKGDYYVGLRNRMQIARAAKADLFISIHADAFEDASISGASVYTLSRNGASSEAARWLAKSENAADLIGGINLDDKEDELASVLLDLSQSATQQASFNVANHVLKNFENIGELHKETVQKASFVVLKSPDIPSILVETAFISNPTEEQNLLNSRYQTTMANAIFKGVRNYFKENIPVDSKVAALKF